MTDLEQFNKLLAEYDSARSHLAYVITPDLAEGTYNYFGSRELSIFNATTRCNVASFNLSSFVRSLNIREKIRGVLSVETN